MLFRSHSRKILHREEDGLVLYALRIEMGRMCLSFSSETEGLPTMLSHADLISTARFRAAILTDRERSLSSLKVGEVA